MEAEDYDAAKELKRDIERIRLSTDGRPAPSRASPPLPGHGSRSPAAHPEHRAEACLIPPIDASEAPSQLMLGFGMQPGMGPMMKMWGLQCSILHLRRDV